VWCARRPFYLSAGHGGVGARDPQASPVEHRPHVEPQPGQRGGRTHDEGEDAAELAVDGELLLGQALVHVGRGRQVESIGRGGGGGITGGVGGVVGGGEAVGGGRGAGGGGAVWGG